MASVLELLKNWEAAGGSAELEEGTPSLILYLSQKVYADYEPDALRPFLYRLERWLNNASSEEDQKILLSMLAHMFFVGPHEFEALFRSAMNEIERWLMDQGAIQIGDAAAEQKLGALVGTTWICPITDSLRINSFLKVNGVVGHDHRPHWRSLELFGDVSKITGYIARKGIERIVLLEDFVGSGSQIESTVEFCASKFSHLDVLLIPLIVCPEGDSLLRSKVDYRAVINRALSRRDPRVSYRVGSRRHSWRAHGRIMGSEGKLENERDYKYVDLDILLKRSENTRTYIFPKFAEDVFQRRMQVASIVRDRTDASMDRVYQQSLSAYEKGHQYNPGDPARALRFDPDWKPRTKDQLLEIAKRDPLSARLGEAWIRQKGDRYDLSVPEGELPWAKRAYWKKERTELALYQIASANQQRTIYSGKEDICDISNGNILVFISLNQHIWDQYLRYEALAQATESPGLPTIPRALQSIGIFKASEHWTYKLAEETGRSAERLNFINELGRVMREKVLGDRNLSYPGATGFSLREDELYQVPWVRDFLGEMADYGNLIEGPHTTKEKDRAARIKWYISPILCPQLRLPYVRTKEPYYASLSEVVSWLSDARVGPQGKPPAALDIQTSLF